MQLAMLVEHDCICIVQTEQPRSYQLMNKQVTLLNEHDITPSIGLAQCGVPNVEQFKVNDHAKDEQCVLVANKTMLEVSILVNKLII